MVLARPPGRPVSSRSAPLSRHRQEGPLVCSVLFHPFAVITLTRVKRCTVLPGNDGGRDFVVGDLHGHRGLLERQLERLDFDPGCDRLFSVGDLIDRGPDSLATLALIEQPWFHAVLGNHELMLLDHLGYYRSRLQWGRGFANGSGAWILDALAQHRRLLMRLADRVAALPMALHVDSGVPFNVMHGDLLPIGSRQDKLLQSDSISVHKAETVTSSRDNLARALKAPARLHPFGHHSVQLAGEVHGELPLTYVGHSPVQHVTVHNSYVYIEQGFSRAVLRGHGQAMPTLLEHARFAQWLLNEARDNAPRGEFQRLRPAVSRRPGESRSAAPLPH